MTIKNRLQKLEAKRGGGMPEVVVVTIDEGRVTKAQSRPELIGLTEAELDAQFSARDDVQVIAICYASQDKEHGNSADD